MGASLYRRGNIWWCWVRDETGQLRRVSTKQTDKEAASLCRRALERRYADPAHHAAHTTTVAKAIQGFLTAKGRTDVAAGTMRMYQQKAGHLARILGPATPIAAVTAPRVDAFIVQREDEGAVPHTIYKELVALRQVLKYAKRAGAFPADISAVLPVGYSPKYEPRTTSLGMPQVQALLAELDPGRAAHVAYVVATGARLAESLRARRSAMGGRFVGIAGSKTAKSRRIIPALALYADLLERAARNAPGKDLLFPVWGNARRDIIRACDRAGVPRVTWNDLRRTFSSILKQLGVRNDELADLLGHETTAMVRKVYGQDTPDSLAETVETQLRHRTTTSQKPRRPRKKAEKTRRKE